jgi:hypothetical protein
MRALPPLALTLMFVSAISAAEPLVRILMPETVTSSMTGLTGLGPEIEVVNQGEDALIYPDTKQKVWHTDIRFELYYGYGMKLHEGYAPHQSHAFLFRQSALPVGETLRLPYWRKLKFSIRFPGTYTLKASVRIKDEKGKWHEYQAKPATFLVEADGPTSIPTPGSLATANAPR